jgi:uncharacterized repeat protein (TIGR01451 family)
MIWTGSCLALAALTATLALTARGQDRSAAEPTYSAGRYPPPSPFGAAPGANTGRARITQPVVAGPEGVRLVTGADPVMAMPPPPAAMPKPTVWQLPPSKVKPDAAPAPAATKLPDPQPLSGVGGTPIPTIPAPSLPPSNPPALPTGSPPALPTGSPPATLPPPPLPTISAPVVEPIPSAPVVEPTVGAIPPKPAFQEQSAPGAVPATVAAAPAPPRQAPSVTVDAVAPESIGVGQPLTYELVVRNVGTSAVLNTRVEDDVPAHCTFVGSDPAAETSGDHLAWSLGTLEPGVERRIKVTVKPADEGELRSRAVVTFAAAVEARVKVTRPKISVAMTSPETGRVGEKVTFQIKLSNTGTGTASRLHLQARFGDGLSHPQGQVIEAEMAALPAGATKTLTLQAVAVRSGPQTCTLTASADGNPAETAKASVALVEPMLDVKQTGPAHCLVRSEPTYTIELTNPGTAATDPVQLWAQLPAGFEFVGASDGGAFVPANRAVGWRLPALPAGGSKSVTLKVHAAAPTDGVIRTVALAAPQPDAIQPAGGVQPARGLEAKAETVVKAEGVPALRFEVGDIEDPIEVGKEAVYEIRVINQGTGVCTGVQLIADLAEGSTAAGATGPTTGKVAGQQIVFDPIPQLGVKEEKVYRVRVVAKVPGDLRFRVRMACDQIKTPVVKEENTRFYKQ